MKSLVIASLAIAAFNGVFAQQCGVPAPVKSTYIIRGDEAEPLEFPWQISLQQADWLGRWNHICGASIIDNNFIFTAAHCVDTRLTGNGRVRVVLGAHDITRSEKSASAQELVRSKHIAIHPMWDMDRVDYDYALIQIPKPLDFAGSHSHLTPICMPKTNESKVFENMDCMVSGWGLTKNSGDNRDIAKKLQRLPVHVPTHDACARAWLKGGSANGAVRLTPRHICAATTRGEGSGVCSGDSGGPLQCNLNGRWVLAGAASFVRYCGSNDYPNVYARITDVLNWVERVKAVKMGQQ